jgi:hypothetical protein
MYIGIPPLGVVRRDSGGAFSPNILSNLALWTDASNSSSLTIDINNNVSQWNDLSGNGRHISQATTTKRPAYVASALNSKPGLTFDGVDDILVNTSATGVANCSIFSVLKVNSASTTNDQLFINIGGFAANGKLRSMIQPSSLTFTFGVYFGGYSATAFNMDPTGAFHAFGIVQSGTNVTMMRDSSSQNGTCSITPLTTTDNNWSIGGYNNNFYGSATICEVIIYSKALSASESSSIKSYLKAKWGTP